MVNPKINISQLLLPPYNSNDKMSVTATLLFVPAGLVLGLLQFNMAGIGLIWSRPKTKPARSNKRDAVTYGVILYIIGVIWR